MYKFEITVQDSLKVLMGDHYDTLESVPDDFFEQAIIDNSRYYRIDMDDLEIGFFSLDDESILIQFYVNDEFRKESKAILNQIIEDHQCKSAMVPTYDSIYLEILTPYGAVKSIHDNLYTLNKDNYKVIKRDEIIVRLATIDNLDAVVDLEEKSLEGAPRDWLFFYCTAVIENKGLYLFYIDDNFVGVGEARTWFKKGSSFLGVIVAPEFRSNGIGEFIISYLIELGLKDNLNILTSVEASNISSNKLMKRLGFDNKHQILDIKLI